MATIFRNSRCFGQTIWDFFFFMLRNQLYFYSFHSRIKLSKFMGVPIITCLWDTSYIFVVKCAEWKKNKEK